MTILNTSSSLVLVFPFALITELFNFPISSAIIFKPPFCCFSSFVFLFLNYLIWKAVEVGKEREEFLFLSAVSTIRCPQNQVWARWKTGIPSWFTLGSRGPSIRAFPCCFLRHISCNCSQTTVPQCHPLFNLPIKS